MEVRMSILGRFVLVVGLGFVAACGSDTGASNNNSNTSGCSTDFCDGLKFGHGIDNTGFGLVGETDTFAVSEMTTGNIYFRLESTADFDSRFVRLYIYSGTGSSGAPYWQNDFTLPQTYGHIMLSSFRVTDAGGYEVRAYLVTSMGGETRVATRALTMTP
jgi:hypothetical protein